MLSLMLSLMLNLTLLAAVQGCTVMRGVTAVSHAVKWLTLGMVLLEKVTVNT